MLRAVALAALGLAVPASAAASSAAEQIAALNAQREANGIPAGIVEVADWSEACRRHMAYIEANGGVLTHEELPGKPGYTSEGAMAGMRSVLSPEPMAFGPSGNAFEMAPLHLMQTLAPALSKLGVSGGCATTGLGSDRTAAQPALFTYPGDGTTGVARSVTANELPFVPGDFVGLAQGTTTGVHLLVMSLGTAEGKLAGVTLSGPNGPVAVRTVDNTTPGLVGYLPPGGIVVPVAPLDADASYTASATFQPLDGVALTRTWSFGTGTAAARASGAAVAQAAASAPAAAAVPAAPLRLSKPRPSARSVTFTLSADPALVGRRARLTLQRLVRECDGDVCHNRPLGRRTTTDLSRLAARQRITTPRPASGRAVRVIVETQAFTRDGVSFPATRVTRRWSPN
jgi:hypothetical protein